MQTRGQQSFRRMGPALKGGMVAGGGRALRPPIGETVIAIGVLALAVVIFAQTTWGAGIAAAVGWRNAAPGAVPLLAHWGKGQRDRTSTSSQARQIGLPPTQVAEPRRKHLRIFGFSSGLAGGSIRAHLCSVRVL